jgi:hypothetical protein
MYYKELFEPENKLFQPKNVKNALLMDFFVVSMCKR